MFTRLFDRQASFLSDLAQFDEFLDAGGNLILSWLRWLELRAANGNSGERNHKRSYDQYLAQTHDVTFIIQRAKIGKIPSLLIPNWRMRREGGNFVDNR